MLRGVYFVSVLFCGASICLAVEPARTDVCLDGLAVRVSDTSIAEIAVTAKQLDDISIGSLASDADTSFQVCGLQATTMQSKGNPATAMKPVNEFRAAGSSETQGGLGALLTPRNNMPHGQVYGLFGRSFFSASDVTLRDELSFAELGASLGGSTGQGRTAYFASFDRLGMSNQKLLSVLTAVQAQTGNDTLPVDANPVFPSALSARVDRRFGQRDSAYAQFSRDNLRQYAVLPGQGAQPPGLTAALIPEAKSSLTGGQNANLPGLVTNLNIDQQAATVGNTVTISPSTVDETKAQFLSTDVSLPVNATAIGVQSSLPTVRRDRVFEAANNVYRQLGTQSIRMGGDFVYNQMNITFMESAPGRVSSGNSFFSQSSQNVGLFVESEKRVQPNLTLTSGVSYDLQFLSGFRTDTNNLAPQVGFAWAPTSSTVIRGGAGIYYDQIPLPAIAGPADPNGVANIQDSGRFVNRTGWHPGAVADFTVSPPSLQNSYAETANVELEQQVGARSVISAESQYLRGVQLALPVSYFNAAELCMSAAACRAGKTFSGQEIGTGASYSYQGTSVAYTQQPVHWGSYKVTYTYATAQGSGTGENTSLVNDQMRRASFTGNLHTSLNQASGFWQCLENGFVLTGTGDYMSRSEFAGFNFINFNARLSKTLVWGQRFHLDALAESFNGLERTTAVFAKSTSEMGSSIAVLLPAYEKIAAAQSPSGSQLGLRLIF